MRALACVFLIACGGGGSVEGEPLIQSTLTGQFDNRPWTPMYGFGRAEANQRFGFYVGSDKIGCGDDFDGTPRDGTYVAVGVDDPPAVGSTTSLFNIIEVVSGDLVGKGASGSIQITGVTDLEVSAVFGFSTTIENGTYALTGAVTLLRCP